MNKKRIEVLPETEEILSQLGKQIKMARLRRQLSVDDVSSKAGISRTTLWAIERGNCSVAIGAYASVLRVIDKMDSDLLFIAKDELFASKIKGIQLNTRIRKSNK